jgi:23S rRNA pseudouridine1911/1915/1917 synthase
MSPADTRDAAQTLLVAIPQDADGERLDRALAAQLPGISRTRLKALIEEGRVTLAPASPALASSGAETLSDPSYRVKSGQNFAISIPEPRAAEPVAQAIDLAVVYEDEEVIVIDKPAGLVVHPAPGNPDATLVNALLAHCGSGLTGIGGVARPGIVHRIDKNTSGLLVAAKTAAAHEALSRQFAAHQVERVYQAFVWGMPSPAVGEITGNVGRSRADRKKMAVVASGGKTALTRYKVVARYRDLAAKVECRLATGRTHQIRVHFAHGGHPLLGDPTYGKPDRRRPAAQANDGLAETLQGLARQALHAGVLGFIHPTRQTPLRFESALPEDLRRLQATLEAL